MPNEHETDQSAGTGGPKVWLVLASERPDGAIAAFWEQADAVAHQAALRGVDPRDVALVQEVVVKGRRRRCGLCREPVVLDDRLDPESWRHADDANDLGDHTAEV